MTNDTPHEPVLMGYNPSDQQYPFQPMVEPEDPAQSSPLPQQMLDYLSDSGDYSLRHFYANWATIKEISRYLDWMKQAGVYDNSFIIIASDHGRNVRLWFEEWSGADNLSDSWKNDYGYFMPLLLVKLPNTNGNNNGSGKADREPLKIELRAHSNADVPAFASLALPPEQRYNPFTNRALEFHNPDKARYSHYIGQNPNEQQQGDFTIRYSYRIAGPIWQESSWQRLK